MKPLPLAGLFTLVTFLAHAGEPAAPAKADATPLPGHSANGEAFNEGPRQAAVLMKGLGSAHLKVTTAQPLAQQFFDQGLCQLHGFWYFEAERSFRQAAAHDPDLAMAYWGMAMANINNQPRAMSFIKEAAQRRDKAGRQEQLYIGAWEAYYAETKKDEKVRRDALIRALEALSYEFPDDLEAKALLVFQLWDNKQHGSPLPSRQAVDAIAQQVLAADPMHPGIHHYLIHLWNGNDGDKRALPSAARGGQAAPGIAHLWHMPGHTFSNLKRYADAAWQQEASARTDHAYMHAARIPPDQIHNFAHNNDWLIKNLGYIGRVHDGVALAKNMIELPRVGSKNGQSYRMGRERLLEMLQAFELWREITQLGDSIYLGATEDPLEQVRRLRALGLGYFHSGDSVRGQEQLEALKAALGQAREQRMQAAGAAEAKAKAEKKPEDQIAKAMADALRGFAFRMQNTESAIADVRLARALQAGDLAAVRAQLSLVHDLSSIRRARVHFALGEKDKAIQLAGDAVKADEAQVLPLATLADLQWQSEKQEEAKATFQKLRERSAQLDLDVPAFARLAPIAQVVNLSPDWRIAATPAPDAGVRPPLDALGPFYWKPYAAPDWSLSDQHGKQVALADYRGQPVLVVFYLGSGCAGCLEQLNLFSPKVQEYADAGIQIVAVSTDSADALHRTFAKAGEGQGFTFPILADASRESFKAYRAFDDFEKIPLHGTFLIDGAGLVRWQDISYQPFRDVTWLLGEAKRLLRVSVEPARVTAAAR